jgi:hypothetical protein
MIELNHFHNNKGQHVYSQVIFYERLAENGQFRVRSWALIEMRESLNRLPQYDPKVDKVVVDMKMDSGKVVRLESRLFKETWTQHDPERRDKDKLPEQFRLRLAVESVKKL